MRRVAALLLVLTGCTPTGGPPHLDEERIVRTAPGPRDRPAEAWTPWCAQQYPSVERDDELPWIWAVGHRDDDSNGCTRGCTVEPGRRTQELQGVRVTLQADGAIDVIRERAWSERVRMHGFIAKRVHWTTWCGDTIVLAAHDGRVAHTTAIALTTGEIVEQRERAIDLDGGADPSFDVQLYCHGGRTSIHARGSETAWRAMSPSRGEPELVLAPPLLAGLFTHEPWPDFPVDPARLYTTSRIYEHTAPGEIAAYDTAERELWRRWGVGDRPGCFGDSYKLLGLVGCSRCPADRARIRMIGDHVALEHAYVYETIDVFDEDGHPIAHVGS